MIPHRNLVAKYARAFNKAHTHKDRKKESRKYPEYKRA